MGVGVDNIPEELIIREKQMNKTFHCGCDKEGRPVIYIRVRLHNKNVSKQDEVQSYCIWLFEQIRKNVLKVCYQSAPGCY